MKRAIMATLFAFWTSAPTSLGTPEPQRVFLSTCEVDGACVPCEKIALRLTGGSVTFAPERFKETAGSQGFIVPSDLAADHFDVIIETPKGTFSLSHLSIGSTWRCR